MVGCGSGMCVRVSARLSPAALEIPWSQASREGYAEARNEANRGESGGKKWRTVFKGDLPPTAPSRMVQLHTQRRTLVFRRCQGSQPHLIFVWISTLPSR
ncbi:Protein of unknown function [Pyronema omphalodes CBS 100304]|uniref:Uncharacterized protein n=1 Tax=Pyronema omphalodes (strain CBS 100304) TaxID=1076935 RepID=U4LCP4_PYROM|nr:Protein of unknown function [Pyronema omphalodes CBS 100304]